MKLPTVNPVLARELTQRMRGRQAWVVLVLYLAILAFILRLVYGAVGDNPFSGDPAALSAATAGRAIFHWLLFFMIALVCFIVPGVTAGAIAGERERQTLVSLQVTLLRPFSIVAGKLWASLAYVLLLVVATLPLVGVTFVIGGVGLREVIAGLAAVVVTAVALACLALACSAAFRRTQGATVTAYALTALLVVGTFVVYGFQAAVDLGRAQSPGPGVLALNPFVATADVVRSRSVDRSFPSPFQGLQDLIGWNDRVGPGGEVGFAEAEARIIADGPLPPDVFFDEPGFAGDFGGIGREPRTVGGLRVWIASFLIASLLALGALAAATRRVTVPRSGGGSG